jgi:palmitoyl-protein thioesterase
VSINNEVAFSRNRTYAQNLASLNKLVLVLFSRDTTVVPKESAWFGSERSGKGHVLGTDTNPQGVLVEEKSKIIPMRLQPLYLGDWIGIRELDERNGVIFEVCEGEHMQLSGCWRDLVNQFVGK